VDANQSAEDLFVPKNIFKYLLSPVTHVVFECVLRSDAV